MSEPKEKAAPVAAGSGFQSELDSNTVDRTFSSRESEGQAESLRGDTAAAVSFLQRWEPNGQWLLSAIIPDGAIETRTFHDEQKAHAWIENYQGKRNLYFSANRASYDLGKKATKADMGHALAAHVDIDPIKGRPLEAERERIRAVVETMEPAPSVVIDSGGGYQCFWQLREALPLANGVLERVEAINQMLERRYGGDRCGSIDHIMRLPGTVNLPTAKKREAGRLPAVACVVRHYTDRLYGLEDFGLEKVEALPVSKRVRELILGVGASPDRSADLFAALLGLVSAGCSEEDMTAIVLDPALYISGHLLDKPDPRAEVSTPE